MKAAVLGTGMVGDTIGSKLIELGHTVIKGSRTTDNEKAKAFVAKHGGKAGAGTFAEAAALVISFLIAEEKRIRNHKRILILSR